MARIPQSELQTPEGRQAVQEANQSLFEEMRRRGDTPRQLTMDPSDLEYRRYWMRAYRHARDPSAPAPEAIEGDPPPSPEPPPEGDEEVGSEVRECYPCSEPQSSGHGGNTTVQVDHETRRVMIRSRLEYSGPDASQAYADHAEREIEDTWTGEMILNGETYQVETDVDTSVNTTGTPTEGYDRIEVDSSTTRMNQTLYGAGPGHQTPAAMDPNRRRIAHEYGHTLGLEDDYHDDPDGGGTVPDDPSREHNIMAETWPTDGIMPHPHQEHYEQILRNYGCTE